MKHIYIIITFFSLSSLYAATGSLVPTSKHTVAQSAFAARALASSTTRQSAKDFLTRRELDEMINPLAAKTAPLPEFTASDGDALCEEAISNTHRLDQLALQSAIVIHSAAGLGDRNMIQLLALHKVDFNTKTGPLGESPLITAIMHGKYGNIEALLKNGALPATATNDNQNALHIAATLGDHEAMEIILKHPSAAAALNTFDVSGNSPFSTAIKSNYLNIAQMLSNKDLSVVTATNALQENALHLAIKNNDTRGVEFILRHYHGKNSIINLEQYTGDGKTALHLAIGKNEDIVRALLEAGANPNTPLKTAPVTPLMLANFSKNPDILKELLKKHGAGKKLTKEDLQRGAVNTLTGGSTLYTIFDALSNLPGLF